MAGAVLHVTSQDGTSIAYERRGAGPPLIVVGGALQHRTGDPRTAQLAALLGASFTVLSYDRRGRGASGDTPPYDVQREVEDLDALIAAAGGQAVVFGNSSGANLGLEAAAHGSAIRKLALWEANVLADASRPPLPDDYIARLTELVATGRRGDAVEYFLTTAVGVPAEYVTPMRDMSMWPDFEQVAHTLAYDGAVVGDSMSGALPGRWSGVTAPTLVLDGGQTPWMTTGADSLAKILPSATRRALDGQGHDVAPEILAPALLEFFADEHGDR